MQTWNQEQQQNQDQEPAQAPSKAAGNGSSIMVKERARLEFLPALFGEKLMLRGEVAVYAFCERMVPAYNGGLWDFFELPNGGRFMAPSIEGPVRVMVEGNGFEGEMSAEAVGITVCLFALSHLSFHFAEPLLAEGYHLLRDYAADHPEASLIFAAID